MTRQAEPKEVASTMSRVSAANTRNMATALQCTRNRMAKKARNLHAQRQLH
jgi:hypothetical protein